MTQNVTEELKIDTIVVDGMRIRYAIRPGKLGVPLLLLNGIGANLELTKPFVDALSGIEIVVFDMPGTGGSGIFKLPKRFSGFAKLTAEVLSTLGYQQVDVAGVSWGGALAQQFARQYPHMCRRLILAATSMGAMMVPGKPSVWIKLVTPFRYISRSYMGKIAPFIYGDREHSKPHMVQEHAARTRPPSFYGYMVQLMAGIGWTSAFWLHKIPHETLIIAGDDDPIVPLVNAKIMASLMNHARLHVIRGGGHLFLVMRANEVVPVIKKFLTSPG